MTRRDWILLLILAAIWGASYLFIEIGIRDLSAPMVVVVRVAFGAIVLLPLAAARGALAGISRHWRPLVAVAGIQVAGPFILITEGQGEITSSLAGILVASSPIFTALLATFFDPEERSVGLRLVGVLVGVVGVGVLLGVDLGGSRAELLGGLAVVVASLGYAIGGFVVKRRLGAVAPIAVAASVLAISTLMVAPFALGSLPDEAPGIGPVAAVVGLGVVGTGVAFAIFYGLLARVGPARSFIVTYLAPAFAVVYGALLLEEAISVATLAGLGLILAGSFLAAEGRFPWQRRAIPPGPEPAGPIRTAA